MACTFLSSQNKPKKIFYHYFHVTGWKIINSELPSLCIHPPWEISRNYGAWWATHALHSPHCKIPTSVSICLIQHLRLLSLTNLNCFSLFGLSWLCWCFLYAQSLDLSSFPFVGIAEIQLFSTSLLSSPVLLNVAGSFSPYKVDAPLATVFLSFPCLIRIWNIL